MAPQCSLRERGGGRPPPWAQDPRLRRDAGVRGEESLHGGERRRVESLLRAMSASVRTRRRAVQGRPTRRASAGTWRACGGPVRDAGKHEGGEKAPRGSSQIQWDWPTECNARREPREAGERRGAERPLDTPAAPKRPTNGGESQQRQDAKREPRPALRRSRAQAPARRQVVEKRAVGRARTAGSPNRTTHAQAVSVTAATSSGRYRPWRAPGGGARWR